CRMAAPEVAKTAANMAGHAIVLKVDTEHDPQLSTRYNVRGIPNFAVFSNGKLVQQQAGLVNHQIMEQWLRSATTSAPPISFQAPTILSTLQAVISTEATPEAVISTGPRA